MACTLSESKALSVTNDDTVSDVIKMALQQFGVEGSDTDYQLWVNSGKDDAPYPLIGHEHPFGIKMNHIRDAVPQIQGIKDSVYPLNLEGPFLMEQLPREMQCQFILKPSRLALCHQLTDPSQKPFKRKRSIINWTFWRGSNTQLDNAPLSPTSLAPGKLFGLSLPAICENDNLPKPVLVSVLVQFLIENCCMIFGEDISLLYANLSAKDDNREDNSDICTFQHIDSSYDSLENELNDDVDSPFSNLTKNLGHDTRSRDSVLTLSDCDLDHPDAEEAQTKHSCRSNPLRTSAGLHQKSAYHEQSENESLCSSTSGYLSTTVSDALKDLRRNRRCSEPTIGILVSRFSQLNECPHENAARKSSCDAVLSQSADDYLKQHRYLQVEGQKLINRSVTLGIDVAKSSSKKQTVDKKNTTNRLLPPSPLRLNICSRTSCSSLSSPGTSPSGSSLSSLDSAFSQFSDYSVLTANEVSSPLDCTLRSYKKPVELTPDFLSVNSFSGVTLNEDANSKQYNNGNSPFTGKEDIVWPCQKNPVSIHPSTWLKNGTYTMKNWSLRKKEKATRLEEKNKTVLHVTTEELQTSTSNISEVFLVQENRTMLKTDSEHKDHNGVQRPRDCKENTLLSCSPFFCEDVSDRKLAVKHLEIDQDVVDRNGNSENDMECSSFLLPSPVSINIEISSHHQENTLIPQTFFFGQNIALFGQTNRRKSTNSFNVEETQIPNSNLKCSREQAVHFGDDGNFRMKDDTTKTTVGKDISIRVASFKKNKILPSNMDTESKVANCDLEKNFCVSPKLTTTTEDFFFQPDMPKNHKKTEECDNAMIQNNVEWQTKCCSDPKFEEIDQRCFAEESYV
ncbi:hypothetical protein FKM82_009718 [Ascaphus truei]